MLELKISIPELKDYVKSIPKIKDNFFDILRLDMKQVATDFINGLMQTEFELFLGREKYQRQHAVSITQRNYRNGHYKRGVVLKGLGKVSITVSVP